jgi:hypothetical protein
MVLANWVTSVTGDDAALKARQAEQAAAEADPARQALDQK